MGLIFLRNKVSGVAPFSPLSLFASGEEGFWYDPSDLTTMWTDTAGTTQTTAVLEGQTATSANQVARIDDKSGNGNHATQGTSSYQPILRVTSGGLYYLEFDGADDHLNFALSNVTTRTAMSFCIAQRMTDSTTTVLAAGTLGSTYWGVVQDGSTSTNLASSGAGDVPIGNVRVNGVSQSWSTRDDVHTALASGDAKILTSEGFDFSSSAWNSPNLGGLRYQIYFMDGDFYGFVMTDDALTSGERSDLETYLAVKSGVTL